MPGAETPVRGEHTTLRVVRDALLVAGIAVLCVQVLRRWAGDRYMVPSDSMEPVLHGDPERGDIVFVAKLASAAARRRHDLVVVQHPEHSDQQLVKRIAARGDDLDACCIEIRGGDLWLGPDPQRLQRETKHPIAARAMRVAWAAWPPPSPASLLPLDLSAADASGGELVLPPLDADLADAAALFATDVRERRRDAHRPDVLPAGFLGTARAVDAAFVDANGARSRAGEDVGVTDCGMDLELLAPVDELVGTVELREQALTFVWRAATGDVELLSDGQRVAGATLPHRPAGAHRVEFGLLDDRAFLVVDDRADATFLAPRRPEWPSSQRAETIGGPRTHVFAGAVGSRPLRLRRLVVFRDVFHWRERVAGLPGERGDWPRCLPAGTWFLLGDNTFDSRDSRHFGAVPTSEFLGVPEFVVGPWPRTRWVLP